LSPGLAPVITMILLTVAAPASFGENPGPQVGMVPVVRSAAVFLGVLALFFGVGLAIAARKFFVKTDPKIEKITEVLAHAHCGACGFAGCEQYAEAVLKDPGVPPDLCTPGGSQCASVVAELTGKIAHEHEPKFARIMCQGAAGVAAKRTVYRGVPDCRAAVLAGGGDKACPWGCLGYGTCVRVCPFDALAMGPGDLPVVDLEKCTGCGKCAASCPKKVIEILPESARVIVACHSKDTGAVTRKYCKAGCIGCGKCVKVCPSGAPHLENNLARIDHLACTMQGVCIKSCPTGAIISLVDLPERKE
jgi:Na+-translocating ferredoxin:NAD+ oxidoreductase subunit B